MSESFGANQQESKAEEVKEEKKPSPEKIESVSTLVDPTSLWAKHQVDIAPAKSAKVGVSIIDSENVFIDDSLANKYKDNEREIRREQRHNQMVWDAENRFRKKLRDWL